MACVAAAILRPTVLVVDDEPDMVDAVRDWIEGQLHYTVLTAASGPQALRMLQSFAPGDVDLVVTDYSMSPMDGIEFLERAAKLHPGVPTLLLTAHGDVSVVLSAINRAKISRYLSKPSSPEEITDAVRELVSERIAAKQRDAALRRAGQTE